MARLLVITHPEGGTSGVFAHAATDGGHRLEEWCVADGGAPAADLAAYDGLVVLGGGQNVAERDRLTYLDDELELIARWHAGGRPLLGVCLGAQLLAQATGGAVVRIARPEIGWFDVARLEAGDEDPVLGFGDRLIRSYQWHSYAVRPPAGAVELARSDTCLQAFRLGRSWGVQFHPEVTPEIVEGWIDDWRADPDAVAQGFDPEAARAVAARELPSWATYGRRLFSRFCGLLS
jgi:GMP synthase (glutamine-hydrolysing)